MSKMIVLHFNAIYFHAAKLSTKYWFHFRLVFSNNDMVCRFAIYCHWTVNKIFNFRWRLDDFGASWRRLRQPRFHLNIFVASFWFRIIFFLSFSGNRRCRRCCNGCISYYTYIIIETRLTPSFLDILTLSFRIIIFISIYRLLNDNELGRIKSDGLFGRLPNLVKLDLRRNQITGIEQNAFEGASKIQDLLLSENKIAEIHNKMFLGLHNLKSL